MWFDWVGVQPWALVKMTDELAIGKWRSGRWIGCLCMSVCACVCVYPETTHWHKSRARISNLGFIIAADWQHINQCATAAWYTACRSPPATREAFWHEAELTHGPHHVSPIPRDSLHQLQHRYCTLNSFTSFHKKSESKDFFFTTLFQANNSFFNSFS